MLADRISEGEYWRLRAQEVGRLVGEEWTETRMLMQRTLGDDPGANIRPRVASGCFRGWAWSPGPGSSAGSDPEAVAPACTSSLAPYSNRRRSQSPDERRQPAGS